MHSRSVLVAALAATASLASAEERPKIYFPRHVKRQFINATSTRGEPVAAPAPTFFGQTAPLTSKRQSLSDFFPPFGLGPSSVDDETITTVVVASTVVVP